MLPGCSGNPGFKPRVDKNSCESESWEVYHGDTINRIDCNNKRQDKWVRHEGHSVRDTMWNRGDTIYFKDDNIIFQK